MYLNKERERESHWSLVHESSALAAVLASNAGGCGGVLPWRGALSLRSMFFFWETFSAVAFSSIDMRLQSLRRQRCRRCRQFFEQVFTCRCSICPLELGISGPA